MAALGITLTPLVFDLLHILIRKSAHVVEYAVLGALLFRCFDIRFRADTRRSASFALVVAAAYSFADEFHQSFVWGRGASLGDCVLDICGAALGVWLISRVPHSVTEPTSRGTS